MGFLHLALFVIFSVNLVRSETTCAELKDCMTPEDHEMMANPMTKEDMSAEKCTKVKRILTCIGEGLDDCAANKIENEDVTGAKQLMGMLQMSSSQCGGGSPGSDSMGKPGGSSGPGPMGAPGGVSCSHLDGCMSQMGQFNALIGINQKSGACAILAAAIACGEGVLSSCGKEEDEAVENAKALQTKHCSGVAEGEQGSSIVMPGQGSSGAMYNVSIDDVPENPTCFDSAKCMMGLEKSEDELTDSEKEKICELLPKKLKCLEKTVAACDAAKVGKNITEMQQQVFNTAEEMFKEVCNEKGADGAGRSQFSWSVLAAAAILTVLQMHRINV